MDGCAYRVLTAKTILTSQIRDKNNFCSDYSTFVCRDTSEYVGFLTWYDHALGSTRNENNAACKHIFIIFVRWASFRAVRRVLPFTREAAHSKYIKFNNISPTTTCPVRRLRELTVKLFGRYLNLLPKITARIAVCQVNSSGNLRMN